MFEIKIKTDKREAAEILAQHISDEAAYTDHESHTYEDILRKLMDEGRLFGMVIDDEGTWVRF